MGLTCRATYFSLDAKQEIIHTEGVIWIHHLFFDRKQETWREYYLHPHHLFLWKNKKPEGVMKPHPDQG
jgi:hypothetical protein